MHHDEEHSRQLFGISSSLCMVDSKLRSTSTSALTHPTVSLTLLQQGPIMAPLIPQWPRYKHQEKEHSRQSVCISSLFRIVGETFKANQPLLRHNLFLDSNISIDDHLKLTWYPNDLAVGITNKDISVSPSASLALRTSLKIRF